MINLHPALPTKPFQASQYSQPAFKAQDERELDESQVRDLRRQKRELENLSKDRSVPKFLSSAFKIALVIAGAILGGATMKVGLEASFKKLSEFFKSKSVVKYKTKFKNFAGAVKDEIKIGYVIFKDGVRELGKKFKELKWVKNLDKDLKISKTYNKIRKNPKVVKFSEDLKSAYQKTKSFIKEKMPTKEKVKTAFINVTAGASAVAGGATAMASGSNSRSRSRDSRDDRPYRRDYD